jgi:hypothetical protein
MFERQPERHRRVRCIWFGVSVVMEKTTLNSAICSKTNLHAAPPQLLKTSIAERYGTCALMPNMLRSTDNTLNLNFSHSDSHSAQPANRNRMGEHEEARKA